MNGKSVSIPFGMVFKKYYCSKCGARLEKEKTHRVVTKDDRDYYQYHEHGTFPRRDYDVYGYQFKCPSCEARISFDEQCIIERIQKERKSIVLSPDEIKENYESARGANNKRLLVRTVLLPIIVNAIFFSLIYAFATDKTLTHLAVLAVLFVAFSVYTVFIAVRKHKGEGKRKVNCSYSHETESQMQRLHAYCSHNKALIDSSERCYCFYCKSTVDKMEIKEYVDDGQTALCPRCNRDSVIPDGIDENIDETTISEMHDYWF